MNVLVFVFGMWIAFNVRSLMPFLAGNQTKVVSEVLHRSGSVTAEDIVEGSWWRLLTAAFVHGSVLHIFMNMSMVAMSFGLIESMWQRWRFLLIYLLAAFGGDCLAVAWQPTVKVIEQEVERDQVMQLVGASGAICGMLAATLVWVLFNGTHLPRTTASQLRFSLITSAIVIFFISLFPQVSGLGHLGGALFGGAAAILLHIHRWKTGVLRWVALAGIIALPWLGFQLIDRARAADPRWLRVEQQVFEKHFRHQVASTTGEVEELFRRHIAPVLYQAPQKRDEAKIRIAIDDARDQRPALAQLANELKKAGPYRNADTEREREAALGQVEKLQEKLTQAEDVLSRNVNSPERDEKEREVFSRQFLNRIREIMRASIRLSRGEVAELIKTPPRERDPGLAAAAGQAVKQAANDLRRLSEALGEAGPFGDDDVEKARKTAKRYSDARLAQMNEMLRCLKSGTKWTPQDQDSLDEKAQEAAEARSEWEKLIEVEK